MTVADPAFSLWHVTDCDRDSHHDCAANGCFHEWVWAIDKSTALEFAADYHSSAEPEDWPLQATLVPNPECGPRKVETHFEGRDEVLRPLGVHFRLAGDLPESA